MAEKRDIRITKRAEAVIRADGRSALARRGLRLDADARGGASTSAPARVGTPATITLMQAIDRLAGGPGNTAGEVLAIMRNENRKLEELIATVRADAAVEGRLNELPSLLPIQPIESLIEKVEGVPDPKPKSAKSLLRIARKTAADRKTREAAWQKGHDLVINEARAERLTLHARTKRASSTPLVVVPQNFLLGGAAIDTTLCHLGFVLGSTESTFRRAIIAPTGDRSVAYFDVVVMADEFNHLMKSRLPVKNGEPSVTKRSEMETWYRQTYVADHVAAGTKPGRDADLSALRQKFGHESVSRDRARELRRTYAPATWRTGGAPKKLGRK